MKKRGLQRLVAMLSTTVTVVALPLHAYANTDAVGWKNTPNGYCYLLADGTYAVGETEIDGQTYLFAPNGMLQLGWQTVNDLRYYYAPNTRLPHFGWLQWRDGEYYITEEAGKSVGFTQTDRGLCYFDAYGVLYHGWLCEAENQYYYADSHGVILTGEATIDGLPYLFDTEGIQQLGWQEINDKRYYFNTDGTPEYQWLRLDGETYYLTVKDGMLIGEQVIDGKPYAFDDDGKQICGWYTYSDGSVAYFDADGDALSGLQSIDGALYYFADDYRMQTGFQSIADAVYYFGTDGSLQTGWIDYNGDRYYSNAEGVLQSGWVTVADQHYYCDANGMLLTDWQIIDGVTYYFTPMGVLSTGWQQIDGVTYYFTPTGVLSTGWQQIDGKTYYFAEDGAMAIGWQLLDGCYYYFGTDGTMVVSSTVDGYILDADGVASTPMRAKVATLLSQCGTTPADIYGYTTSHYRYKRIEDTRTFAQLQAAGWDSLVEYTLVNRQGVCYYLAATTDYFLQLAGNQTRIVYAHSTTGDHYWCQVWNGTEWRNYDPTYKNRCDLSLEQLYALKQYTIYGYANITYNERGDYMGITYTAAN